MSNQNFRCRCGIEETSLKRPDCTSHSDCGIVIPYDILFPVFDSSPELFLLLLPECNDPFERRTIKKMKELKASFMKDAKPSKDSRIDVIVSSNSTALTFSGYRTSPELFSIFLFRCLIAGIQAWWIYAVS